MSSDDGEIAWLTGPFSPCRLQDEINEYIETPDEDSPHRQRVHRIPRPPVPHLPFPTDAHPSEYQVVANLPIPVSPDSDDDPNDMPGTGHISPCTFRALAQGTVAWNDPNRPRFDLPVGALPLARRYSQSYQSD